MLSGGPEVSCQLADALNRDVERAFMLYCPLDQRFEVPAPYRKYRVRAAVTQEIESDSIVIVPEGGAGSVDWWRAASDIYFWWLSVDNFILTANSRGVDPEGELEMLQRRVTRHLYQSDYARRWLQDQGVGPVSRLSDPLAAEYRLALTRPPSRDRRNIVVYSPSKGIDRTEKILAALSVRGAACEVVPIKSMSPDEVRGLLGRAKVSLDFGHHPGKDRLSREAAACGACVITNRRGSAGNPVDVPIPEEFKIDDKVRGFEHLVVDKIEMLLNDFPQQQPRFEDYRQHIAQDSADWFSDVAALFPC
jgi:hypothetical protein